MLFCMKLMAVSAAATLLMGCASNGLGEGAVRLIGNAVSTPAPAPGTGLGSGSGAGSVASGGTGYLPCAAAAANRTAAQPDCR